MGAGITFLGHSAVFNLCHIMLAMIGQPGDKRHLVFECQALEGVCEKSLNLFGEHAGTVLEFMCHMCQWQADAYIWGCKIRHGMFARESKC